MKFSKANVEIIKINTNDVVTVSCSEPGMFVQECEFE